MARLSSTDIIPFLKCFVPPSCHDRVVLVGGTVRDMLVGSESQDIDLAVALSHDELSALGFYLVEATSGATIYFTHHPEFGTIEVTRINNMTDLEEDLQRRDFTINAMAMNLSGVTINLCGGEDDLKEGRLRACTDSTFTRDPLRIFRAFRFEADGWSMEPGTAALIHEQNWSAAFSATPVERFGNEMLKALAQKRPEIFFQRMIEFNVGAEFLPEIFRMPCIPAGPPRYHPEGDLFTHSIQVLQRVAGVTANPLARFCALFHDLGKLATDPALYPRHHGHDFAGFSMAVEFCTRLRLSAAHRKALAWVSSLHGKANIWNELRDSTKLTMAERARTADILEILPQVAASDKLDSTPMAGWDVTVRVAEMNTQELGIDQERLAALPVKNRQAFILQKRVQVLRERLAPEQPAPA